jgi:hypothetical protein
MDLQRIIDVCDAGWEAHKFDCSGSVKAVRAALGVGTFTAGDNATGSLTKSTLRCTDRAALATGDGATGHSQGTMGTRPARLWLELLPE